MPFLLLDDATDEAKRRLQDFGQQQLTNLTAPGQTVQPGPMVVPPGQAAQRVQQAPQQVQGGLQDITARLQDFGQQQVQGAIQTLQPLQAAQQQKQQDAQNALGRLQTFGSDQLTSLTKAAQPVTQTFTNQFGGQQQQQPDQVQVQPGGDLQAYARQAAQKAGIDPDIFVRQIQQESGFNPTAKSPAGALGIAQFMPGTAQGMNVDPTDPYAALDAAARLDAQNLQKYGGSWGKALAAYNAGGGAVDQYGGVPPYKETQSYVDTILQGGKNVLNQARQAVGGAVQGAQQAVSSALPAISQFGDKQLTAAEAYAACGPAAAVRFAALTGRQPTLREATDLARQVGWNADQGMAGLGSESALFDKMQIPHRTVGADWHALATEAASGNPVVISTPGHYFTADGYNAQSGAFHVGSSGTDLKAGGEWMTPAQMEATMGRLQGGLAVDNPQVPGTSPLTRGTAPSMPGVSSPQDLVGQGIQKLQDITAAATAAVPPGQVFKRAGQGLEAVANAIPEGAPIPPGVPSPDVLRVAGHALQQPGPLESMQTIQDLQNKYGQGFSIDANGQPRVGQVDTSLMTPEDREAYNQAALVAGGVAGATDTGGPTMGGGTTGISQSPTFLREALRRMYPGAINKAAAKEATQNSVDASRGIAGALTQVNVDNTNKTIQIVDQGKGMSPQTMEDVFVKLGGSQKPAGASGGMGTAIKAIMANAEDTWVRTIGRDPNSGELMDSVMHGSGDDFLSGNMHRYYARAGELPPSELTGAPPAIQDLDITAPNGTGTAIWTKPLADVNWSPSTLDNWVRNFNQVSRIPDQNVEFTVDGQTLQPGTYRDWSGNPRPIPEESKPSQFLKTISVPGADIDIYASPGTQETSYADIHLLNNGQYQADQSVGLNGNVKLPTTLVADVRANVDPRNVGYPWTADRNSLIDTAQKAVNSFVKDDLATEITSRENTRVADTISNAPMVGPVKLVDDAGIASTSAADRFQEVTKHPGYRKLASIVQDLHDNLIAELQGQEVPAPGGAQTIQQSHLVGLGVSDKWLGLNVPPGYTPWATAEPAARGVLINPWSIWQEVERSWPNASRDEQISRFGDGLFGTMLHELAHNTAIGGHGEEFSGVLTRLPQFLGSTMQQTIARQLQRSLGRTWDTLGDDLANDASTFQSRAGKSELERYGLSARRPDVGPGAPGDHPPLYDQGGAAAGRPGAGEPLSPGGALEGAQPEPVGFSSPRGAAALGLGAAAAGAALGSNQSALDQAGSFVSPVTNAIGGALDTAAGNLGLRPRTADEQAQLSAGQARMDASGARYEPIGLESLLPGGGGPSAIGPTSPGDELDRARQQWIAQNNPLRETPYAGDITSGIASLVTDPVNLALMASGLEPGKAALDILRDPRVADVLASRISGEARVGAASGADLVDWAKNFLRSRTGPSEGPVPHGMAVPETGYQAGTPEYTAESALRQAAADQGTHRPNLTQAELQALPGMAGSHLSDLNELREAVQTGLPAMRWYTEMAKQIATDTGQNINPREAAVLMGATAGNAGVPPNYHSMLSVFRAMRLANPDLAGFENLSNKAIQDTQAFKDVAAKIKELATYLKPYDLARIMQGYRTGEIPYPSGAKLSSYTTNFLHALSDLYDPYTTQDVWQGRLMGSRLVPDPANPNKLIESVATPTITNDPTYRTAHALTNWIARELNINPREAQAAGWGVIRSLWNDETIGPQLQTGQITLRDALRQGMQQGMFDPRQLQSGMLSDVLGGTGTKWDAKIAQARDLIRTEGLYDTPPPPSATGVESMSSIHPADWNAATGLNKADIPRPVSEPLATGLGDIARVTAPVIRVPGTLEGTKIPGLLLEHSIQRAGDNSYVHLVGGGDAAAQDVASRIGGDLISHYDPQSEMLGGFAVRGLGADEQNALARQLRMNGVPVVEGRGPGLSVPYFGEQSKDDILGTIEAGVQSLGPDAAAEVHAYTGSLHPVGPGVAGVEGDTAAAAGRPDLPVWASDQGAPQAPWWAAREPGLAYAPFAARLGGGALGGLAGYATTPPEASPQERAARTAAGVGVGLAAPFALSGNVGRVIQASRVGSLAGGLPTLVHIGLNLPVQTGLKLASDLPASVLGGHPEASASELYGVLQGLRAWGINASKTLGQPGPMASSMGGGVGPQVAEAGLTGLVRLHPLVQDMARQVATHMDLYKTAATEATTAGLTRFGSQWRARVAQLVNAPTSAMASSAEAAGNRAALGGAIGSPGAAMGTTGTAVKRAINDSPLLRFILPIFDIGYHVAQQGVETSPLGIAGTGWDVVRGLTGAAGGGPYAGGNWAGRGATGAVTPLAERFRNNMIGMALAYEGYNQAEQGNITGEGPSDAGKQAELRNTGWQPDSIRIGGRYFSAHLLGPVGWSLIQGANAYEATHGSSGQGLEPIKTPQGERAPGALDIAGDLVARQGRYFNNETFLRSLGDVLNTVGSSGQAGQMATREAASIFESLIPQGALLANVASVQDPFQRNPRAAANPLEDIQNQLMSRLPGQREQLQPRISATGRQLSNPQEGWGILAPRSSLIQGDPILEEMQSLGVKSTNVPKSISYGSANEVQLTPQEQYQWQVYRGQALSDGVTRLMASAAYKKLGDVAQRNALAKVVSGSGTAADAKLRLELSKQPGFAGRMIGTGAGAPVYSYAPGGTTVSPSLSDQLAAAGP